MASEKHVCIGTWLDCSNISALSLASHHQPELSRNAALLRWYCGDPQGCKVPCRQGCKIYRAVRDPETSKRRQLSISRLKESRKVKSSSHWSPMGALGKCDSPAGSAEHKKQLWAAAECLCGLVGRVIREEGPSAEKMAPLGWGCR